MYAFSRSSHCRLAVGHRATYFFHFNFGSEPDVDVSLASVDDDDDDDVVLFTEKERKNVFVPICRYNTKLTPTIRKEAVCYV